MNLKPIGKFFVFIGIILLLIGAFGLVLLILSANAENMSMGEYKDALELIESLKGLAAAFGAGDPYAEVTLGRFGSFLMRNDILFLAIGAAVTAIGVVITKIKTAKA